MRPSRGVLAEAGKANIGRRTWWPAINQLSFIKFLFSARLLCLNIFDDGKSYFALNGPLFII